MRISTWVMVTLVGMIAIGYGQEVVIKDRAGNNAAVQNGGLVNSESAGTGINVASLTGTVQTVFGSHSILIGGQCTNEDTVWYYVQIFNNASPSVGTTVPTQSVGLPPGSGSMMPRPVNFPTAVTVAATTTPTGSSGATSGKVNCNFVTR